MANFEVDTKKFLDYTGLQTFWGLIKSKFVAGATIDGTGVLFTKGDGNELLKIGVASKTSDLPGLMTKDQAIALEAVSGNIETATYIKGIKIGDTKVAIPETADNEKLAAIALKYISANESGDGKPYIVLYDPNGTAESKIDATAFVQDAFLKTADIVVNPEGQSAGTYLKLVFNTKDNGEDITYVDIADMFVPYTVAEAGGLREENRVLSIKVKEGEKYLETSTSGLATKGIDTAIKTAADAAQAAAEQTAADALAEALGVINNETTGILANAKKYTDDKITEYGGIVTSELDKKADKETTYTKTEVNTELAKKADADKVYTKDDVDGKIAEITGEGGVLSGYYTKTEVDEQVAAINKTIEENEETTAAAYNDLNTRVTANANAIATKADATATTEALAKKADADKVYTKEEVYNKTEVDGLLLTADGNAQNYANAVYAAIVAITKTDIEKLVNG